VEVFEEAFGELIDPSARLECVADGFVFIEGPVCIPIPEVAAYLNWGDDDARTMYITASTTLYRLRCRTTGYVPYRRA
jgi:hypothetical protein